ncbi:MAG: ATP-binding protein [Bacteroidota bacterium]
MCVAYCFSFFIILFYSSCSNKKRQDHPLEIEKLKEHAIRFGGKDPIRVSAVFDSGFRFIPEPGPGDEYAKIKFRIYNAGLLRTSEQKAGLIDSLVESVDPSVYGEEYVPKHMLALLLKGDNQLNQKKFKHAYTNFYRAREEALKYNIDTLVSEYYSRLASVCYQQGEFRQAGVYERLSVHSDTVGKKPLAYNHFMGAQSNMNNLGMTYIRMDMPDSAIIIFNETIRFTDRNEHFYPEHKREIKGLRALLIGNSGTAYLKLSKWYEAEKMIRTEIEMDSPGGPTHIGSFNSFFGLGDIYIATHRLAKAKKVLEICADSLKNHNTKQGRLGWLKLKRKYCDAIGDTAGAYKALSGFTAIKDTLDRQNRTDAAESISLQIKNIEREYLLDAETKSGRLKSKWLIGIGALTMVAFAFVSLTRIYLIRSRKNVEELKLLNQSVTEKNEHMQKAVSSLEQSQADNARVMKVVAHDLRSPIGGIQTAAEIVLEDPALSEENREFLELIKSATTNSLELITELLHTNIRLEDFKREEIEMSGLLRYCVEMLRFKAEKKNQQLHLVTDNSVVFADREKLWRVFSNLVTNAIKFSPRGAPINISLRSQGDWVVVLVEDKGIGIPEKLREGIFDMFTESRRPGTAGEQTFGLGLAISKEITEAHGGKIWFESNTGSGTSFFVKLPLSN